MLNDKAEERLDILELSEMVREAKTYSLYGKIIKKQILKFLNDCLEAWYENRKNKKRIYTNKIRY